MIRACAAYKAGVVLSDPYETRGPARRPEPRAHLRARARGRLDYRVSHGEAVALGLLAALRLSGLPTDAVEEVLRPGARRGRPRRGLGGAGARQEGRGVFVLLEAPGKPVVTTVPDVDARAALAALIRQ